MRAESVGDWSQTEKEEPAIKRGKGGIRKYEKMI